MTTIPKPKHCEQNWLDMKPTDGGRLCGQCSKTIVDFSEMTWAEIEHIQQAENYTVCGMYSPEQLDHWGREVPTNKCSKFAATTALLVSMTVALQSFSQMTNPEDLIPNKTVHGRVTSKTENGKVYPLEFAIVVLKGTDFSTFTDEKGNYELELPDGIETIGNPTLVFSYPGLFDFELILNKEKNGRLRYDAQLPSNSELISYFSITKPTAAQRISWRFKKWFGLTYRMSTTKLHRRYKRR